MLIRILIGVGGILLSIQVKAGAEFLSFEASGGMLFDSDVAVDEIDLRSGLSDEAVLTSLDGGADFELANTLNGELFLSLTDTNYSTFDEFDSQTRIMGGGLSQHTHFADYSVSLLRIDSDLDGRSFLTINQLNPSMGRFFSDVLFASTSLSYSDKSFSSLSARNADNIKFGIHGFYFLDHTKSFGSIGLGTIQENAPGTEFDYEGIWLKLGWVKKFGLFSYASKLNFGFKYQDLSYGSGSYIDDQENFLRRQEESLDYYGELEVMFRDDVFGIVRIDLSDNTSNDPSQDFQQNLFEMKIGYRL